MNGANGDRYRLPPAASSASSSSATASYPNHSNHSTPTAAGYRANPYYGTQQQQQQQQQQLTPSAAARFAHEDFSSGSYTNGGGMTRPPQPSPSAAAAALAHAQAQAQLQAAQLQAAQQQYVAAAGGSSASRQQSSRPRPTSQQRIAMENAGGSYPDRPVSPASVSRGSFTSTSTHYLSTTPSRASSSTRKKPTSASGFPSPPPPPPPSAATIEEGDYVWVSDPGSICVPAVVARMGYYYDEAKDHEQPVVVVHTEDGEEREIRDTRALVRLPVSHHPKTKPPLESHDLSGLALMSAGEIGRNEVFSTAQLENIVLYTLRSRYRMEQVYTWVDRVLVSVNPVVPLPIFTPDHMQAYNKNPNHDRPAGGSLAAGAGTTASTSSPSATASGANDTPPHVFAVAQNAIQCMQDAAEDQAVVILGGMGSGKSETAKLIVQYLCEVGENPTRLDMESDPGVLHPIGQQILHAFTVLEAFGNAATPQNANSSRFAKMISVEFSRHGFVIGGGFTTHYFEKSRVIERREQERNFHVFYQVLAGVQHDPTLRDALELNKPASDFALVRTSMGSSNSVNSTGGSDRSAGAGAAGAGHATKGRPEDTAAMDARDYRDLMSSFSALRIRKHQRMEIVKIIAAILHLGNVEFVPDTQPPPVDSGKTTSGATPEPAASSSSSACALKDPAQIVLAAKLLEVEPVVLDNYFRTRQFFSKDGNSKTVSSLKVVTVSQAKKARDTFIRSLYESLFSFLVETLNGILGGIFDRYEKSNIVLNSQGIHVLDIVGFENLDGTGQYNGFDQLCFNYWSEKVHNFYIQNTLATNLADVDASEAQHIELRLTQNHNAQFATSDMDECLNLFENIPFGIFALLNDHSKVRSPNDEDLVSKILAGNDGVRAISRPKLGQDVTSEYLTPSKEWRALFVVEHYCGKVTYSGKGLSTKNTLTISATCAAIMHSSKNAVLHAVGAAQVALASSQAAGKQGKPTTNGPHSKFVTSTRDLKSGTDKSDNSACSTVMHQADALLNALTHTGKNFVVCVKPTLEMDQDEVGGAFDSEFVMQQIRDAKIVDLIRASRSVYSVRLTHQHFFRRYKSVCGHRGTLESLLRALSAIGVLEEEKFVVGHATVYLTSHQWKKLEQARSLYLNACATMIQRNLVRGAARKKSAKILELMQAVRMAMAHRESSSVVAILDDCVALLGKRGVQEIRVLHEARASLSQLDEEAYVQSVMDDATSLGHLSVIEYAILSAEKWCPHMKIDTLRALQKQLQNAQQTKMKRGESTAIVNEKLRESIVKNDPDALMAALATLEEASMESLERKLATMMIIRALEEKSIVESVTNAVAQASSAAEETAVVKALLAPALKAIEYGLKDRFSQVSELLASYASTQSAQATEEEEEEVDETPSASSSSSALTTSPRRASPSFDATPLLAALDKAMSEDNLIAAQRVLQRLETLGVSPDRLMVDAKAKIDAELSSISVANERKLILKFLNIAKVSQDLELLNQAIDAAVDAGLAKWDFNLKNAERERDKLTAAAAAGGGGGGGGGGAAPPPPPPPPPSSLVQANKMTKKVTHVSVAKCMLLIWTTNDESKLQALKTSIPQELGMLLDAKISRRMKVADVELQIQRVLASSSSSSSLSAIEDAFQRAISTGHCVAASFSALFDAYQCIQKRKASRVAENEIDLVVVMKFFMLRLDRNAELRDDALEFLAREVQKFTTTKNNPLEIARDRKQEIESSSQSLRRKMDSCLLAAQRLESALLLPAETLSVAKLESTLEAAKKAGVHKRLLAKAEDKIFAARRSTLTIGDRPSSISTIARPFDDDDMPPISSRNDLTRMMSDTTGWDGEFNETSVDDRDGHGSGSGSNDDQQDASAFHQFERLRSISTLSNTSTTSTSTTISAAAAGQPTSLASAASIRKKQLGWEGRALSQSLSVLDDLSDCRLALSINRCVLGYMRDRIVFYREMLAQYILQIGLVKNSLVDEIYLQLMKQLTKNPKRDSSIRGWSLFAMCATSFPPSQALEKYVLLFLQSQTTDSNSFWRLVRNFAAYSLKKLENLLTNGATGFIPSIDEIRGYEARPPFLCTVELLDGTPLAEQFPVTPELTVDHLVEICAHFLGLDDRFSKFLGLCAVAEKTTTNRSNSTVTGMPGTSFIAATEASDDGNGAGAGAGGSAGITTATASSTTTSYFHKFLSATTFLHGNVFLGDIFEKELIRGRELKFQLKIRLHPLYVLRYEDEMYDRLMYIQLQDEIVKGNLTLLEEDAVVKFTSLAIAIDCGDDDGEEGGGLPRTVDEMRELNVLDYVPLEWQATNHSEQDWAEIVLAFWRANLLNGDGDGGDGDGDSDDPAPPLPVPPMLTTSELQRIYIEEAARHRLFGASFFPCKLLTKSSAAKRDLGLFLGADVPSYFVLGVNCYGIHFIGRDGALLAFCGYNEIVHWGGSYQQYKITLAKQPPSDSTTAAAASSAVAGSTSEDLVVTTKYSDELSALLSDYKEITALMSET